MNGNYIKLYRQITENEFYFSERFTKMQAWIDLLLLARYSEKPSFVCIRGNMVEVKRGELCYSIRTLAKRWKWNARTVMGFLSYLSNRQMIQYRTSSLTTTITVLNWEEYQGSAAQSTAQNAAQTQHRVHTYKKDKKERKKSGEETHGTQSLITFFCSKHEEVRKSKYAVQRGKDHAAAKTMLDSLGLEECKARAVRYLTREDKWNLEHGYTLHNMAQIINGLNGQESGFEASVREGKELQRIRREKVCQT